MKIMVDENSVVTPESVIEQIPIDVDAYLLDAIVDMKEKLPEDDPKFAKLEKFEQLPHLPQVNEYQKFFWGKLLKTGLDDPQTTLGILFNDKKITREQAKDVCGPRHRDMYEPWARKAAASIAEGKIKHMNVFSGMYGGKSSFVEMVIEILEQDYGYSSSRLIAGILGKGKTNARVQDKTEDAHMLEPWGIRSKIGKAREAAQNEGREFNVLELEEVQNHVNTILYQIQNEYNGAYHVVYIDEASFIDDEILDIVLDELDKKDIRTLRVGLQHDAKGIPLSTMEVLLEKGGQLDLEAEQLVTIDNQIANVQCKSFTPTQDIHQDEPNGTMTARYIRFPVALNSDEVLEVLDIFGLPLAVDKSEPAAHYVSAPFKRHVVSMAGMLELILAMAELEHDVEDMQVKLKETLNRFHANKSEEQF